jgi:hypothetical protein
MDSFLLHRLNLKWFELLVKDLALENKRSQSMKQSKYYLNEPNP